MNIIFQLLAKSYYNPLVKKNKGLLANCRLPNLLRHHSFSTNAIFSEKLTFLTWQSIFYAKQTVLRKMLRIYNMNNLLLQPVEKLKNPSLVQLFWGLDYQNIPQVSFWWCSYVNKLVLHYINITLITLKKDWN